MVTDELLEYIKKENVRGVSLENIKENCLRVFENIIFMGIDDDHRKLGAFHALSALTVVSVGARNAMPWLYESLIALM
jgi:hypothetical protein